MEPLDPEKTPSDLLAWLSEPDPSRAAAPEPDPGPTVRRVNHLLEEVVKTGASALHLEPDAAGGLRVRLRIDGMLHDAADPHVPAAHARGLLGRMKIVANLDIAERRVPQCGKLTVASASGPVSFAADTVPAGRCEMLVLRRLDSPRELGTVDGLGLDSADLARVRAALAGPPGVVLATGPRHAGKRTFLETCLRELVSGERGLVSIGASPREIEGVVSVPVHEPLGFTRHVALRMALGWSSEVVALDELHTLEQATMAFDGAVAGTRVLASVPGSTAARAVQRLFDMGVGPDRVAHGLSLVVAPRLLRRLCPDCKTTEPAPEREALERLVPRLVARRALRDWRSAARAVGCAACRKTGYRGLVPVFEVLVPDERLRSLLVAADPGPALVAIGERTTSHREAAILRAYEGVTTVAEALRVTG
jgi:type IV pilus assembly protein PilB